MSQLLATFDLLLLKNGKKFRVCYVILYITIDHSQTYIRIKHSHVLPFLYPDAEKE
jgi:hypothetical protein